MKTVAFFALKLASIALLSSSLVAISSEESLDNELHIRGAIENGVPQGIPRRYLLNSIEATLNRADVVIYKIMIYSPPTSGIEISEIIILNVSSPATWRLHCYLYWNRRVALLRTKSTLDPYTTTIEVFDKNDAVMGTIMLSGANLELEWEAKP